MRRGFASELHGCYGSFSCVLQADEKGILSIWCVNKEEAEEARKATWELVCVHDEGTASLDLAVRTIQTVLNEPQQKRRNFTSGSRFFM